VIYTSDIPQDTSEAAFTLLLMVGEGACRLHGHLLDGYLITPGLLQRASPSEGWSWAPQQLPG